MAAGPAAGAASSAALAIMLAIAPAQAADFGPCAIPITAPDAVAGALDDLLAKAVDPPPELMKDVGAAPGAVLSVHGPNWTYAHALGVADPETGAPIDCDMPFQIGSNTKMMTATLLLQLMEEGKLGLDDPLSRHLPEVAAALPHGAEITLRQLATHTAGIFSYTDNAPDGTPGIMEGDIADPAALRRGYRPQDLVDFAIARGRPVFAPRADGKWAYSNTGYVLLGLVIEKIEGRPLAASLKARIFEPLGMDRTFLWGDVPRPEFGLPRAFFATPFDLETTDWNMSQGWAAGAVISTAADTHRFIEGFLAGELFRSPDTLAVMQTAVPTGMITLPRYGIGLAEKAPGLWGHGGQTLGFESDVALFEAEGISVVGWASSAHNVMQLGALLVAQELNGLGLVGDLVDAAPDGLRGQLTGTVWQLRSIERPDGETTTVGAPESYTIAFSDDGRVAIQADCNRVLGGWNLDGRALSIAMGPSTLAACPPGSIADAYVAALGAAQGADVTPGQLALRLSPAAGVSTLTFEAAK